MKELEEYVHSRLAAEFDIVSRQMSNNLISVLTKEDNYTIITAEEI